MRKLVCLIVICLLIFEALPAFAVEGSEVELRATTVPGAKTGAVGEFDITLPDRMVFRASGTPELAMPYASIVEFSSREEVKYHIGVLPAIIVGLLKSRHKLHFITISYRDQNDIMQVASFESRRPTPASSCWSCSRVPGTPASAASSERAFPSPHRRASTCRNCGTKSPAKTSPCANSFCSKLLAAPKSASP